MSALYRAAAHVQWRADPLVDTHGFGADCGANYIHHGIDSADFVEVDRLD